MTDIKEKLRGNAPLLFDDRFAIADEIERLENAHGVAVGQVRYLAKDQEAKFNEIERLREWQRRAVGHLLTLEDIGDAYGMESAEVAALIAEARATVHPAGASDGA